MTESKSNTDAETETDTQTESEPESGGLRLSRRDALHGAATGIATFGLLSAAKATDGTLENNAGDALYAAGVPNLDQQYERERYVTAPDSMFDPSALEAGELGWVADTGEIGVWDGAAFGYPPLGNFDQPGQFSQARSAQVPVDENDVAWALLRQAGVTEGDYVPVYHTGTAPDNYNFTDTSYMFIADIGPVPYADLPDGDLYISLAGDLTNDTAGETTYVRLDDQTNATALTGTEVSKTGTDFHPTHGPRQQYDPGGTAHITAWGKVTGTSTGTLHSRGRTHAIIWLKV